MRRALALARRGQGAVEPNPMVGAVIVRGNRIIAEGYHHRFGGPHAEVEALREAEEAERLVRGATLYVTLEPCSHWGKTPPCADAVAAARVARVVAAMVDPFPKVRGKGIALLRKRGIRVDVGLLAVDAAQLNAPFLTRLKHKRPYIIAKWAQSIDGCIATASGESKWISGEESRAVVQRIRGRMDAIVVGIGTALADDPLLMARPQRGSDIKRIATRIVLDTQCRLPPLSQLVRTIAFAPLMLVHAERLGPPAERRRRLLAAKGVMTLGIRLKHNRPDLFGLLSHLAQLDYTNILVEGGGEVLGSFFREDLVDEAHVFVAPMVIGGRQARHAVQGPDIQGLVQARVMKISSTSQHGPDLHLIFRR